MMNIEQIQHATILLVDDEPTGLGVLFNYFTELGLTVRVAQSGEGALELIKENTPDIILLDILMPGIDGFEVCRRLKENDDTRDIPVIFMSALTDTVDKVKGFEAGGVDYITKPLQHEELLARVNTHLTIRNLQQQLQAQNVRLDRQNEQLKELNANKDKFFSIIAHDLQSPLSSLRTITQCAAEHLESDNLEKLKEIIELQQTSTDKLFKLLENLLTWSRIQRGMIEYRPQPIEIGTIVARNIALFALNAAHKQITLRNSIQEEMTAYADYQMVDTIVRNLIANALKFTDAHGTVTVSATQKAHDIAVSVSDTGIGIEKKHLPKLFRIDVKYKRLGTAHEQGTGLGLILCKEFVERNGGRIWVESEVGKGSRFTVSLPWEHVEKP